MGLSNESLNKKHNRFCPDTSVAEVTPLHFISSSKNSKKIKTFYIFNYIKEIDDTMTNITNICKRHNSTISRRPTEISNDINRMEAKSSIKPPIDTKTENSMNNNNSGTDNMDKLLEDTRWLRSDEGILKSLDNQNTSETKTTKNIESSTVYTDDTSGIISETYSDNIKNSISKVSSDLSNSIPSEKSNIIEAASTKVDDLSSSVLVEELVDHILNIFSFIDLPLCLVTRSLLFCLPAMYYNKDFFIYLYNNTSSLCKSLYNTLSGSVSGPRWLENILNPLNSKDNNSGSDGQEGSKVGSWNWKFRSYRW